MCKARVKGDSVSQNQFLFLFKPCRFPPRKIFKQSIFPGFSSFPPRTTVICLTISFFLLCVCVLSNCNTPKASGLTYFLAAQQSFRIKSALKKTGRCQTKWNSSMVIYVRLQKCTLPSDGLFLSHVWFQDRPEAAPDALIAKIGPLFSSDP